MLPQTRQDRPPDLDFGVYMLVTGHGRDRDQSLRQIKIQARSVFTPIHEQASHVELKVKEGWQ
jgi:hypothetical protein